MERAPRKIVLPESYIVDPSVMSASPLPMNSQLIYTTVDGFHVPSAAEKIIDELAEQEDEDPEIVTGASWRKPAQGSASQRSWRKPSLAAEQSDIGAPCDTTLEQLTKKQKTQTGPQKHRPQLSVCVSAC
jgi:hypothetical protein